MMQQNNIKNKKFTIQSGLLKNLIYTGNVKEIMGKLTINKNIIYIIIILFGILFLSLSNILENKQSKASANIISEDLKSAALLNTDAYVNELEKKLSNILQQIQGVGSVSVMITLKSGKQIVVATDEKTNEQLLSDTSKTNENIQKDTKITLVNDQPLVLQELSPQIEGVVITAQGAESLDIQSKIIKATTALLDVGSHKVAVFAKQ